MTAGGFCDRHQRYVNEFGWCDECGEPVGTINPPLALSDSVLDVTDGFSTDDDGRIIPTRFVRSCENHLHVFASVDGYCQCGKNRWPTEGGDET